MKNLIRNVVVILIYTLISFIFVNCDFGNNIGIPFLLGLGFSMLNEIILNLRKLNGENFDDDENKNKPKQLND